MLKLFWRRHLKPIYTSLWISFWKRMPDRCKRMCFLTTIYASTVGCTEDDTAQLQQISHGMGLSRDPNALRFPALMTPVIWRRYRPDVRVSEVNRERYIRKLLKLTPCWLMYADVDTMRSDLRQLMDYCKTPTA